MPTPSPTIVATVGANGLTDMKPHRIVMPAEPTASPDTATTTGRPAATTERNISSRMTNAATTPMISPVPFMALPAVLGSSPPRTTWMPASWVGSTAFASGSASP